MAGGRNIIVEKGAKGDTSGQNFKTFFSSGEISSFHLPGMSVYVPLSVRFSAIPVPFVLKIYPFSAGRKIYDGLDPCQP
jgi:hypothetical protein